MHPTLAKKIPISVPEYIQYPTCQCPTRTSSKRHSVHFPFCKEKNCNDNIMQFQRELVVRRLFEGPLLVTGDYFSCGGTNETLSFDGLSCALSCPHLTCLLPDLWASGLKMRRPVCLVVKLVCPHGVLTRLSIISSLQRKPRG